MEKKCFWKFWKFQPDGPLNSNRNGSQCSKALWFNKSHQNLFSFQFSVILKPQIWSKSNKSIFHEIDLKKCKPCLKPKKSIKCSLTYHDISNRIKTWYPSDLWEFEAPQVIKIDKIDEDWICTKIVHIALTRFSAIYMDLCHF